MDIFKGQNLLEFSDRFKTDDDCKEYMASIKAKSGYKCTHCNHTACQIRKDFARQRNISGHIESATADTLFHKVKFGVRKAFFICFEIATTTKSLSASYMSVRYCVTEKTAKLFMHKVRKAMASGSNNPMDRKVHVDEFVLGGKDQGKTGRSYDSKKKKAVTAFQLTQVERNKGPNFKALQTMIHQVKSWIRTTCSWVGEDNLNGYFNEFCFRINPSRTKATIFNNLATKKMVQGEKIYQSQLISN